MEMEKLEKKLEEEKIATGRTGTAGMAGMASAWLAAAVVLVEAAAARAEATFGIEGYRYRIPVHANLVRGLVTGDRGDYRAVRYEDVAWLRNALEERYQAMNGMDDFRAAATNEAARLCVPPSTNVLAAEAAAIARGDVVRPSLRRSPLTGGPVARLPLVSPFENALEGLGDAFSPGRLARGVLFLSPSNALSTEARLVETGLVAVAGIADAFDYDHLFASNAAFAVTGALTREGATNAHAVAALTNAYRTATNAPYVSVAKRAPRPEDFCTADFLRPPDMFDFKRIAPRPSRGVVSLYAVTNLYAWLRRGRRGLPKPVSAHPDSVWTVTERTRTESREDSTESEVFETDRTFAVTGASPVSASVFCSHSAGANADRLYWWDSDERAWKPRSPGAASLENRVWQTYEPGDAVVRIATPVSTNAYWALGGRSPVASADVFALLRLSYNYSSYADWTSSAASTNGPGIAHSTTNADFACRVMVPLGEAREVYLPNHPDSPNVSESVCLELRVEGLRETVDGVVRRFARTAPAHPVFGADVPILVAYGTPEFVPVHPGDAGGGGRPPDPSVQMSLDMSATASLTCAFESLYASFVYDFETRLGSWNDGDGGGGGGVE